LGFPSHDLFLFVFEGGLVHSSQLLELSPPQAPLDALAAVEHPTANQLAVAEPPNPEAYLSVLELGFVPFLEKAHQGMMKVAQVLNQIQVPEYLH